MDDESASCGMCGGQATPLGTLGTLSHYRCRNCGMDFSQKAENQAQSAPAARKKAASSDYVSKVTGERVSKAHGDRQLAAFDAWMKQKKGK